MTSAANRVAVNRATRKPNPLTNPTRSAPAVSETNFVEQYPIPAEKISSKYDNANKDPNTP